MIEKTLLFVLLAASLALVTVPVPRHKPPEPREFPPPAHESPPPQPPTVPAGGDSESKILLDAAISEKVTKRVLDKIELHLRNIQVRIDRVDEKLKGKD
jgi:hypothetical protein